jgi:hypothetical protein
MRRHSYDISTIVVRALLLGSFATLIAGIIAEPLGYWRAGEILIDVGLFGNVAGIIAMVWVGVRY